MNRMNGDEISRGPTSQRLARIREKYFSWQVPTGRSDRFKGRERGEAAADGIDTTIFWDPASAEFSHTTG